MDTFAYLAGFQQKYIDLIKDLPGFARGLTKDEFLQSIDKLVCKYANLVVEKAGKLAVRSNQVNFSELRFLYLMLFKFELLLFILYIKIWCSFEP